MLDYHSGDAFGNSDATGRKSYYGITGTPTAKIDGKRTCSGGGTGTFSCYNGAYNLEVLFYPALCTLRVDVDYDSTTRFLKVKTWATAVDTFPTADAHLRYAIAESHKPYSWQGLDSLHHIVRKMLPNYVGIPFSLQPGEVFIDSQTYTLSSSWVDRNCSVVAFVQADNYDYNPVFHSIQSPLFPTYVFGDCTGDDVVDAADIVYLIAYLFREGESPNPYGRGDVNRDCIIEVSDAVYLLNYLFRDGPDPQKGCD